MADPSPTDLPRGYQNGDSRLIADPSALTVAMMEKAIATLRDFYDSKLEEMHRAVDRAHEDMVRVPTLLDRAISEIKTLYDVKIGATKELVETEIKASMSIRNEKFIAVDKQFEALALRSRDLDEARATALIAALAAAKELVGAANLNFTKQIDGLQTAFTTQIKSLDEKVNDVKDTVTRVSSATQGGVDAHVRRRMDTGSLAAIAAAGVAALMLLGAVGTVVLNRPPPPSVVQYVREPPAIATPAPTAAPR